MTDDQKRRIEVLLAQVYSPEEADQWWLQPQAFMAYRFPEDDPETAITALQALVDGAYL